ncbi:unnamed protein product [Arabis nemorensis]|uniref:RING-CH-type domain-containing protein n=1 Tax=Arabis nemorensis TaxID=586526 RepID=A0A565BW37_9BRAS|nr:unnamed protein product [Arabis nemorensis]
MLHIDLEQGTIGDRRLSFAESDVSECFTGCEDDDSCFDSNTFESCDECSRSHVSSVSKSEERVCRVCQLEVGSHGQDLIELGCSCKGDLAFAHRQCAETWFKLKGDEICEICQLLARNVAGGNEMIEEEWEEGEGDAAVAEDRESWWQRRSVMSIVIICWLLAFIMYFLQCKFKLFSDD